MSPGYASSATAPPEIATLTQRAARERSSAAELVSKLSSIRDRVVAPEPEKSEATPVQPDHALFAIEAAQQCIERAHAIAERILSAL